MHILHIKMLLTISEYAQKAPDWSKLPHSDIVRIQLVHTCNLDGLHRQ